MLLIRQRQPAPSEEVGEDLDVARDARHQRTTPLLVVVGDADPVDVRDQAGTQVVERSLAANPEPHDRRAATERGDELRSHADHGTPHDEPEIHALVVVEDPAVDRLLHDDRDDHLTAGADGGDQPGDAEPLSQHGCFVEAATDRTDRREPAHRFAHTTPPAGAADDDRSASKASTSSRYSATVSIRRSCGPCAAMRPSST